MKPDSRLTSGNAPAVAARENAKKKKQLAFIAVLLFVLLVALATAPSGDPSETENPTGQIPSVKLVSLKPPSEQTATNATDELVAQFVATTELPTLSRKQILSVDLFQRPIVSPDPEPGEQKNIAKPSHQYQVGAIYGAFNGTERSALLDGEVVHSGKKLDSGIQIISISPEGVEVAH